MSEKQAQEEALKNAATEGHFYPLRKRMKKISKSVEDIIAHQEWEREKEQNYKEDTQNLSSHFVNMVIFQLLIVIASAVYSVINLRKFFVKKAIYWLICKALTLNP